MMGRMPRSEYADDEQRLKTALAHAIAGHRDTALAEVRTIAAVSPDRAYRLWQALAKMALNHPGGLKAVTTFHAYRGTDIDDAPVHVRYTIRFLHARAARDRDSMEALYLAARNTGRQVCEGVVGLLLDAAGEAERTRQDNTRRGGTFGNGKP